MFQHIKVVLAILVSIQISYVVIYSVLQERVGCHTAVDALREIRQRKDNWRG